ncbi:MAG: hypothetical protein K940chlam9_00082 [Chlamydiae bacterium]|nr:hypothetical protein [Chlamydiota bacterium]
MKPWIFLLLLFSPLFGETNWTAAEILLQGREMRERPEVAVNQAGTVLLAWCEPDKNCITSATYHFIQDKWSDPAPITFNTGTPSALSLIIQDSGEGFAAWVEGEKNHLHVAKFDSKLASWTEVYTITQDVDTHFPMVLSGDQKGNAMILWKRWNGFESTIQASYFSGAEEAWSQPVDLSKIGFDCEHPQFAFDEQGNGLAVWSATLSQDKGKEKAHQTIEGAYFRKNENAWNPTASLSELWKNFAFQDPSIAFDEENNALVVWKRQNLSSSESTVQAMRYLSKENKWTNAKDLSREHAAYHVRLSKGGRYCFVVWCQTDDERQCKSLVGRIYDSQEKVWEEITPLVADVEEVSFLHLTTDGKGNATLAYNRRGVLEICQFEKEEWLPPTPIMEIKHEEGVAMGGDSLGNTLLAWGSEGTLFYSVGDFLLPPKKLMGQKIYNSFPAKTIIQGKLHWEKTTSPGAVGYIIRRDGKIIAQLPTSYTEFMDYKCPKGRAVYSVTTLNENNLESYPSRATIR